jgi:hypothetical protein
MTALLAVQTSRNVFFALLLAFPLFSKAQKWTGNEIINSISINGLKNHSLLITKGYTLERRNAYENEYVYINDATGLKSTAKTTPSSASFNFPEVTTAKNIAKELIALDFMKTDEVVTDLSTVVTYLKNEITVKVTFYYMLGSTIEVTRGRRFK